MCAGSLRNWRSRMKINAIRKLVICEPPNGPRHRERVCELVLSDTEDANHAANAAIRLLRRVCSLLPQDSSPSRDGDLGQPEDWIGRVPATKGGGVVALEHKRRGQDWIGALIEIMVGLADLHGWEVEDRRTVGDDEEEKFLEAVAFCRPDLSPEDQGNLADEYAVAAYRIGLSPWRLLVCNMLGLDRKKETVLESRKLHGGGGCPHSHNDRPDAKIIPFRKRQ